MSEPYDYKSVKFGYNLNYKMGGNNNLLYQDKFQLIIRKFPGCEYMCTDVALPGISQNAQEIQTPLGPFRNSGKKTDYGNLQITFKVDENLNNYKELFHWLRDSTGSITFDNYKNLISNNRMDQHKDTHSVHTDGTLMTLKNSKQHNIAINFVNLMPVQLSGINFNFNGSREVLTADVTFTMDYFEFI
jgi:hypothetical protein